MPPSYSELHHRDREERHDWFFETNQRNPSTITSETYYAYLVYSQIVKTTDNWGCLTWVWRTWSSQLHSHPRAQRPYPDQPPTWLPELHGSPWEGKTSTPKQWRKKGSDGTKGWKNCANSPTFTQTKIQCSGFRTHELSIDLSQAPHIHHLHWKAGRGDFSSLRIWKRSCLLKQCMQLGYARLLCSLHGASACFRGSTFATLAFSAWTSSSSRSQVTSIEITSNKPKSQPARWTIITCFRFFCGLALLSLLSMVFISLHILRMASRRSSSGGTGVFLVK